MRPSPATSTGQLDPGRAADGTELRILGRTLEPKAAALFYVLGSFITLGLGMMLNHVLTDGTWRSAAEGPRSRLGTDTSYITNSPYDLTTLVILLLALLGMGVGFLGARRPSLRNPWFLGFVSATLVFGLLSAQASASAGSNRLLLLTVTAVFGFTSLVWLFAHYVGNGTLMHGVRATGFMFFGLYWAANVLRLYIIENGDYVNAAFAGGAVFFFNYFAYHELLSIQRREDPRALQWLAGASFLTTGVYVASHKVQVVAEFLILNVAKQTTWLLQFFGQGVYRSPDGGGVEGSLIYYPTDPANAATSGGWFPIEIILACTAIQSIMIFVGGISALHAPVRGDGISGRFGVFEKLAPTYATRRLFALLLTVPLIYVLNLFRNVIILSMSGTQRPFYFADNPGATRFFCQFTADPGCSSAVYADQAASASFWFSHNVIGKGGSLVALIIIAFMVFQILPELYDSLVGLLDLKRRRGPLERYFGKPKRRPAASSASVAPEPNPSPSSPAPVDRLESR